MKQGRKQRKKQCPNVVCQYIQLDYKDWEDVSGVIKVRCQHMVYCLKLDESHGYFTDYFKSHTETIGFHDMAKQIELEFKNSFTSGTMLNILKAQAAELSVDVFKPKTTTRNKPFKERVESMAHTVGSYINQHHDTPTVNSLKPYLSWSYNSTDAYIRDYNRKVGTVSYRSIEQDEIESMFDKKRPRGRPKK